MKGPNTENIPINGQDGDKRRQYLNNWQDCAKHKEQSDNRTRGCQTQRILGSMDKTEPNTENIRAVN
jgi:hypothetical protein